MRRSEDGGGGLGMDLAGSIALRACSCFIGSRSRLSEMGVSGRRTFFGESSIKQLASLGKTPRIWQAVWEARGKELTANAEDLRKRVALEIFADTHAAFANARFDNAETPAASDRAFCHLRYLRDVLPLTGMTSADQGRMIAPAVHAQIEALEKAKLWDQAVAAARDLLEHAPENIDFQKQFILAHFNAATKSLSDQSTGQEHADAERLRQGIDRLEEFRRRYPHNSLVYELIGHLQYLRAIRLANGKNFPDALVATRKAQVYCPSIEAAAPLMTQLADMLKKLQTGMADVEKQLRQRPNSSLTSEGKAALAQSRRGFGPLDAYTKSDEIAEVVAGRDKAQARAIWLEIGLPPGQDDWDIRAASLLEVIGSIFSTEPATTEALSAAFERQRATRPTLAEIDPQSVADFIKRRREKAAASDQAVAAPSVDVAKIPILDPDQRSAGRDREPLGYWIFGHQDYGARLAALAAVVAIVGVASAAAFDAFQSHIRAEAYAAIIAATRQDDDRTVIREADRFFGAPTLRRDDRRDTQVRSLVEEAHEAPNRRARDAAFNETQAALARGDQFAALRAVEKFAKAPPLKQKDARATFMRDLYAREFVQWFASLDDRANATAVAQSEIYRRLSGQLDRMAGGVQ